ncbi:MAG: hypothetical protein JNJ53_10820 [Rhizobiales bacterium]|nr:hypothetical protein [Hyphomicrobiales bacterium]
MHQIAIAAGDVIDIRDRRVTAILRLLPVKPSKPLNLFHGEFALWIERRYLGTLLVDLGGKLLRRLAIEISVNEPG